MDESAFRALLTSAGQSALTEAISAGVGEADRLRTLTDLRRRYPADLAAAAVETAIARTAARAKFSRAAALYGTRAAVEQATAEPVALHRARRFAAADRVVDLGCGIGGDALALASVTHVIGVDRDRLRLLMAQENARAYGVAERTDWLCADITDGGPVLADAAFVDPARRDEGGRRRFNPRDYAPPLDEVLTWRRRFSLLAVKVAPGLDDTWTADLDGEVEFVALGLDLKEAVLWFDGAARGRRATVLPAGVSLVAAVDLPLAVAPASAFLIEPNPAVIRAHLIGLLAQQLDAWQIDPTIAYLSADRHRPSPFTRAWPVEAVLPFGLDRVRAYLRGRNVGSVTVKKRGSPLEPEAFARSLRLAGAERRTVFLTRQQERPVAIICGDAMPE